MLYYITIHHSVQTVEVYYVNILSQINFSFLLLGVCQLVWYGFGYTWLKS